ncbi:retrovirus-related pol polyprotein from transposon TNT 1-94, partial [Tanacetum coccineum]
LKGKDMTISNLKMHIANLKGKAVADCSETINCSRVNALGMYKLDLEPLSPKLRKNREAHVDYLKKATEHANTLCNIVEQSRVQQPQDSTLDYTTVRFGNDHVATIIGKSKKHTHKPKAEDSIQEKMYLLHMDLCNSMRIESINGKKYILVIVDDYSRFTWVKFLRSKDETPKFMIKFMKQIQVRLNATVRNIRIDNGTEIVNQTLKAYYEDVEISHQSSVARTLQQNNIVKRHNQTLVEAACTIEDLGKLKPKADNGIFISYSPANKAYEIYNKRTRLIMETIEFDELTVMASEQFGLGPELQLLTPGTISLGIVQNPSSSTPYVPPTEKDWKILFHPMFDEYFQPSPKVVSCVLLVVAPIPDNTTGSPSSTFIDLDAPTASTSLTSTKTQFLVISKGIEEQLQPT